MRIVITLPGATRAHAERVAAGLAAVTGGAAYVVEDDDAAKLQVQRLQDTSRFVLANMLGCHVATVDQLEAALAVTLLERAALPERGPFDSAAELYMVLQAWPCWQGQRHQVVAKYRALRGKLAGTRYALLARGGYGFIEPRHDLGVVS